MRTQLWTINALAAQLKIDRRTLAKQLAGLPPAKTKKRSDGSVVKYWHLADVVEWLRAAPEARERDQRAQEFVNWLKVFLGSEVYPGLLERMFPILTRGFVDEVGLTKAQALRAVEIVAVALSHALAGAEKSGALEAMEFSIPHMFLALREMGAERFIAQHWTD